MCRNRVVVSALRCERSNLGSNLSRGSSITPGICFPWASQVTPVVKNLPVSAGDVRRVSIPGSGRSPGGHGNPLQYSCLENPTERGAWWAAVYRVAKSQTQVK